MCYKAQILYSSLDFTVTIYFDSVQGCPINLHRTLKNSIFLWVVLFLMHTTAFSQDLEPRRWTVLSNNTQVVALGAASTSGDLFFDPVLEVEDADLELDTFYISYVRTFLLAGKPARFDALIPWQHAKWLGLENLLHNLTFTKPIVNV